MKLFQSKFFVKATLASVLAFHHDTSALAQLTPFPMRVELHQFDPLSEGSLALFTLRLGPIRLPWTARHEQVGKQGFTDVQIDGPLAFWRHEHRFTETIHGTCVADTIQYQLHPGSRGFMTSLFFNPIMLRFLFFYRSLATRRGVRSYQNAS
jgi:ligand-binding SRPBCC domain-containing protein